jgi:hypothetical protein
MQMNFRSTLSDHRLAILFVGVGAVVLTLIGDVKDAMFLYGALAAYGLKNGVSNALNQQTQTEKDTVSTVPLTSLYIDSIDSAFSQSLLSLADEAYET